MLAKIPALVKQHQKNAISLTLGKTLRHIYPVLSKKHPKNTVYYNIITNICIYIITRNKVIHRTTQKTYKTRPITIYYIPLLFNSL